MHSFAVKLGKLLHNYPCLQSIETQVCGDVPAAGRVCREVRYDLTTSQSEWPNLRQQSWAIKRWPLLNKRLQEAGIRWQEVLNATDERMFMDDLVSFRSVLSCRVTPSSQFHV